MQRALVLRPHLFRAACCTSSSVMRLPLAAGAGLPAAVALGTCACARAMQLPGVLHRPSATSRCSPHHCWTTGCLVSRVCWPEARRLHYLRPACKHVVHAAAASIRRAGVAVVLLQLVGSIAPGTAGRPQFPLSRGGGAPVASELPAAAASLCPESSEQRSACLAACGAARPGALKAEGAGARTRPHILVPLPANGKQLGGSKNDKMVCAQLRQQSQPHAAPPLRRTRSRGRARAPPRLCASAARPARS